MKRCSFDWKQINFKYVKKEMNMTILSSGLPNQKDLPIKGGFLYCRQQ